MMKQNIYCIFTMLPILCCAFIVNNIYMSLGFIFMGIAGIIYHGFIHTYRFFVLDIISISTALVIYTVFCKIPEYIKTILYIIEFLVILFLFSCLLFNIKYSNLFLLVIISLIWLPLVIFSVKYISNTTGWISIIVLFLYMSSTCICNNESFLKFSWPIFHLCIAVLAFIILYEMDFLRPEVYKPIEHILDKIIEVKESLISS